MRKILIIHTSTAKGGAEHSLLELIDSWKNKPVKLYIVWNQASSFDFYAYPNIKHKNIQLPYLNKPKTIYSFFKSILIIASGTINIWRLIKKENIQLIYCNTLRALPYCVLISWFYRIRIVCHCRDNIPKLLRRLAQLTSIELIAISSFIYNQLSKKSKKQLVYNGIKVSPSTVIADSNWLYHTYKLPYDQTIIGNIGNILPWKNQLDYVSVALILLKKNPRLHFFLMGEIVDKSYFLKVKQIIKQSKFESNFTFTGYIDNVQRYISCMSVIVHTAIDEPFGRVLAEAGALYKPVVAYDSGSTSEIIIDNVTGYLIPVNNVEKMAESTAMLLDSSQLIYTMGNQARKHVLAHFSSTSCACKIYNILNG